ncbi:hypothetical protein PG996_008978 [Apiospora saccharicola]|uniref:Uncharacterized protein n=1 Tax=Apiospora saccharicola TaxID=335842 RepID=A0ABR1V205_9PEZI
MSQPEEDVSAKDNSDLDDSQHQDTQHQDTQSLGSQGQASPAKNESWDWSGQSPVNPDLDAPGWSNDDLNMNSKSAGSIDDHDLAAKANDSASTIPLTFHTDDDDDDLAGKAKVFDPFASTDPFPSDNPFNSSNDNSNANAVQGWDDDSGAGVASTDSPAVHALADNGLVDDEFRATGIQKR